MMIYRCQILMDTRLMHKNKVGDSNMVLEQRLKIKHRTKDMNISIQLAHRANHGPNSTE